MVRHFDDRERHAVVQVFGYCLFDCRLFGLVNQLGMSISYFAVCEVEIPLPKKMIALCIEESAADILAENATILVLIAKMLVQSVR